MIQYFSVRPKDEWNQMAFANNNIWDISNIKLTIAL